MPYNFPDYTTGNCGGVPTTIFTLISKTGNPPVYTIQANVSSYISVTCSGGVTRQHPATTTTFTDTTLTPYGLVDNLVTPTVTVQSYTFDGTNLNITFSILNGGTYPKNVTLNTWAGTSTKSVTNPTNINPVSVQFQVSIPGSPNPTPLELYDSVTFDVFFNQSINSGTQGQNVGPIDILLQNGNKITNVILTAPDYVSLQNNIAPFVVLLAGTGTSVTTTPHTTSSANFTYSQIATMISNGTGGGTTNPVIDQTLTSTVNNGTITATLNYNTNLSGQTVIWYLQIGNLSIQDYVFKTVTLSNSGTLTNNISSQFGQTGQLTLYSYFRNTSGSIQYLTSSGASSVTNSVNLSQNSTSNHQVTIKAINGVSQTFIISSSDDSNLSSVIGSGITIVSDNITSNSINSTLNDIGNFIAANGTGGTTGNPPPPTPPPVVSTPTVSGNNVTINYSSTGTAILITRNGIAISSTATLTTGTLVDQGLNPGSYEYTFIASKVGVQSTPVTVIAVVSNPIPAQTNFAYNIQIPNVANALQLITATNYGTTQSISFPARAFVNTILNQDISTIPNTLNALFISNVGTTPNEIQVANALIGYFPTTPPPAGQKRSIIEIAGGIFAGLITLSLFTSGNTRKGKR